MKILIVDLEVSINDEGSPEAKYSDNDYYTIIYGSSSSSIVVEHSPKGFNRTPPKGFLEALKTTDILIGHNIGFDLRYLMPHPDVAEYFKRGGRIWDTALAEYMLSGQRHTYPSLAELQASYLHEKIKKDRVSYLFAKGHGADKIIAAKNRCKRLWSLYEQYCYDDGSTTIEIFKKQVAAAKKDNMLKIIGVYSDYLITLTHMHINGININLSKCEEDLRDLRMRALDFLTKASDIVAEHWSDPRLPEFNISSTHHKSAVLFGGKIKVKVKKEAGFYKNGNVKFSTVEEEVTITGFKVPTTLSEVGKVDGVYKTGSDIVEKIHSLTKNPKLKAYCEYQKEAMLYEKMATTYLAAFLKLNINSKIHPNYNITHTITGRLSSSAPNLQNVPATGEMSTMIQGQFVSPPGYKCVNIDMSQLEVYILALLANDKLMINDLKEGVDFHVKRLAWIPPLSEGLSYEQLMHKIKIEEDPKWCQRRKEIKPVSFTKAYGGGAKRLAEMVKIPVEDMQAMFDAEDRHYVDVARFQKYVEDTVNNNTFISEKMHLAKSNHRSRKFNGNYELLPIYDSNGDIFYREDQLRYVGYIQSMTGKRYAFEQVGRKNKFGEIQHIIPSTILKNYLVQGTAADVMACVTYEIFKYSLDFGKDVQLLNTIHDSVWLYVKEEDIGLHIPKICAIMCNIDKVFKHRFNLEVPLKFNVEAKIGNNFATMETYNGDNISTTSKDNK